MSDNSLINKYHNIAKEWHPTKNPINKKYNVTLFMNTIERLMDIEKTKYNLVYIWECEYLAKTS